MRRLEILEACAKVNATLPTFISAFKKFKQGFSASELYKALSKVHKFKVALEVRGLSPQTGPTTVELDALISLSKNQADIQTDVLESSDLSPEDVICSRDSVLTLLGKRN